MRFGGANFSSDDAFLDSGKNEAARLVREFGLSAQSSLLEVGSGTGRLPLGIVQELGSIKRYEGIDVSEGAVSWCRRHLATRYPWMRFTLLSLKNERYNPHGQAADSFRFPFDNAQFDAIYLYSVFSHMLEADVQMYLNEFARVLRPGGGVFLTAFLEENVPPVVENPENYRQQWKGPLHCVRYDCHYFNSLVIKAGLKITSVEYAKETDGQSGVILRLA